MLEIKSKLRTVQEMLVEQLNVLQRQKINERYLQRKYMLNNANGQELGAVQAAIKGSEQYIKFLYEMNVEAEKEENAKKEAEPVKAAVSEIEKNILAKNEPKTDSEPEKQAE